MVVLQSMRAESSRPLRSRLWSLFTALATFQWFRQATRPDEIQGVGETHHLLMEGTVKSHCKEYTYRNGRSYCGHLCKQSTMLHPLVAIIHIPPTCRIDSPPPMGTCCQASFLQGHGVFPMKICCCYRSGSLTHNPQLLARPFYS